MTKRKNRRPRKLSYEILALIAFTGALAALLFWTLYSIGAAIVENYCFYHDVEMTEFDWIAMDRRIFIASGAVSCVFFSLLFLALIHDRMVYIRTLTRGIHQLRMGQTECTIPIQGRNELTELAEAIHEMTAARQQLREKEQALAQEKEALIRTLSHDIRTPLTSILAYSEYLAEENDLSREEQKRHLALIRKKGEQIRDLSELLLDGGNRNPEHFADAHLLMEQLAAEFEEALEESFTVQMDLSGCTGFAGAFDVQELRRIFDNLSSNVQKYADPNCPVSLKMWVAEGLHILQTNGIPLVATRESGYQLGIHSIRRIAQHYGGRVEVRQEPDKFEICVTLSEI